MAHKLLIIDDSDLIRISLQKLLEPIAGIEAIHTASTLAQALSSSITALKQLATVVQQQAELSETNPLKKQKQA